MITQKKPEEIELLKTSGAHLAEVLMHVRDHTKPGVSTDTLNDLAEAKIEELGDEPAFLGYTPDWTTRPYPAALNVSINNVVVHGIPNENPQIIQEGDIVSIDCGVVHEDMYTDSALTVIVGEVSPEVKRLVQVTKEALDAGIRAAQLGNTIGDIGAAIEGIITPHNFGIVTDLAGHGVGYGVHEDPYIPNIGRVGEGPELKEGMVIAIEPMVTLGDGEVIFLDDGYTVITADESFSAHFEHTVAITANGPLVLTRRNDG